MKTPKTKHHISCVSIDHISDMSPDMKRIVWRVGAKVWDWGLTKTIDREPGPRQLIFFYGGDDD